MRAGGPQMCAAQVESKTARGTKTIGVVDFEWPAPTLPTNEIQHWAIDAESFGVWTPYRAECMPLRLFPDDHLWSIRYDVEQGWKPPYWRDVYCAQIPNRSWFEWHWQRGIDPDIRRPAIPKWIRKRVLERDGYVCQLCGSEVEPADVHLDHIHPWSRGGEHTVANLQVTHSVCNIRKGARV